MAGMPLEHSGRNAASTRALEELEYALRQCQPRLSCDRSQKRRSGTSVQEIDGDAEDDDTTGSRGERLLSTLETEIIPRLLVAHTRDPGLRPPPGRSYGDEPARPDEEDMLEFTRLILEHDSSVALSFIDSLRSRGVQVESIFLNLLAPAARRLGEMWEEDSSDFVAVTIALGRLQQTLHDLRRAFLDDTVAPDYDPRRRVILTSYAEDQHIFGALMVAEFLRRAQWSVTFEPCQSIEKTRRTIQEEWYAIVGLSISRERDIGQLKREISEIRRVSSNHDIAVLVGGRLINENPDLVAYVDADATAANAELAAEEAENLFAHIC